MKTDLDEALAIARELARLAVNMNGNPIGSVGTQIARLEELEKRIEQDRRDAEALAREEKAWEDGAHVDREEARQERMQRMREWDIAMGHWMP